MMRVQLYNVCLGGVTSSRTLVFFFPFLISSVVTQIWLYGWYIFSALSVCVWCSVTAEVLNLKLED